MNDQWHEKRSLERRFFTGELDDFRDIDATIPPELRNLLPEPDDEPAEENEDEPDC